MRQLIMSHLIWIYSDCKFSYCCVWHFTSYIIFSLGHFGTSTMTYFRFLRWLMFLNLLITIIMSGVVLAPFLALKPSEDSEFVSSVNACRSQHHFLASFFSQNYTGTINATRRRELPAQLVLDVLQGTVTKYY